MAHAISLLNAPEALAYGTKTPGSAKVCNAPQLILCHLQALLSSFHVCTLWLHDSHPLLLLVFAWKWLLRRSSLASISDNLTLLSWRIFLYYSVLKNIYSRVYMCCVCLCICGPTYTWGPEEDVRSPGPGVTSCMLMWVLGTTFWTSGRTGSALNHEAISQPSMDLN